jgi:formylglycine-generating enzyme
MRFERIPAGSFLMGSDAGQPGQEDERPVHRVEVDAFEMSVFPVTRAEYAAFLDATGHDTPREWTEPVFAAGDLPVVGVSWHDAVAYCAWRARSGSAERLPTEAEWERAARGGIDGAAFPWGDDVPAWIPDGGRGPLPAPWPVTLGEPNPFGLFGIAANVHEWCADWHDRGYYAVSPAKNPRGPDAGDTA